MEDQKHQKFQNIAADPQLASQIAKVQNINPESGATSPQPEAILSKPDKTGQTDKSDKAMTDAEAQALLTTFSMQNPQKPERKLPMGIIITVVTLIILAVVASTLIGLVNKNKSSGKNSSNSNSSSQNGSPTNDTSNQINNDVKSCQNPEVALSEC